MKHYTLKFIGEPRQDFTESDDMMNALYARYPNAVTDDVSANQSHVMIWASRADVKRDIRNHEVGASIIGVLTV